MKFIGEGRLLPSIKDLEREGDYCLRYSDDEIAALWMILPRTKTRGRIPAIGHGHGKPEWSIWLEDGTATVSPSIDEGNGGYHGCLQNGVWSDG